MVPLSRAIHGLDPGISPPQFHLMRLVASGDAPTVSEVSEQLDVTLSAVTLLADRLHAAGLLTRERDEQDRRLVRMRLTEAGQVKLAAMESQRLALMRHYLCQLSQEELDRFLEIFTRIAETAEGSAHF